jgi:hypothetical protein
LTITTKGAGCERPQTRLNCFSELTSPALPRTCGLRQSTRSCDVLTNATGCALVNTTNLDAQTGQQVIENGVDGGQINPILETVEFTIASPQVYLSEALHVPP